MTYSPKSLKYQHVFISSIELTQEIVEELLEVEIRFDIMEGAIISKDRLALSSSVITILVG